MAVDKNGEYIDVSDVHFSVGVTDSADGYTAPAPSVSAPTASVSQEPSTATKTRYYSGKARYVSTKEGETKVVLTISGLATQDEALLVGKGYDSTTHMLVDTGRATQIYSALSFKAEVEGGYKYFQYLKGSVAPFKQDAQTSTNDVNEKTTELTYTALTTIFEGFKVPTAGGAGYETGPCKRIVADTREDADVDDTWFNAVQKPELWSAPSALSFTPVPIDGATNVSASVHPAITFNNEIASQHVFLVNDTTDAETTATVSLDTTGKILTIVPASALTAGGKYAIVLAGIEDVYGQALTNQVIYFTVAS
jgi:phi13 family phage major tail protein